MNENLKKAKEQEKRAKALRENLKKRKEQRRARVAIETAAPKSPLEEKPPTD